MDNTKRPACYWVALLLWLLQPYPGKAARISRKRIIKCITKNNNKRVIIYNEKLIIMEQTAPHILHCTGGLHALA